MRWKHKSPIDRGARKCVREFLFLPKTLNRETRWLEWAEVQYVYVVGDSGYHYWKAERWVNH